jgi:hypothetical protein
MDAESKAPEKGKGKEKEKPKPSSSVVTQFLVRRLGPRRNC